MDINNLLEKISDDKKRNGSYDRYPVRFISMKYKKGVSSEIIKLQQNIKDVELLDIKDLLPHDDAWITVNKFVNEIYSLNYEKSYIVMGFSEYARFLSDSDLISLLISLLEVENKDNYSKRRLYIPCFALFNKIKKIIKEYHRRLDVYDPILNDSDVEDLPRIFFLNEDLNIYNHKNEVTNSSEWFGIWRNSDFNTNLPIVCSSKTLAHFYSLASPENVYNIKRIKTYRDILQYMYGVDNLHEYKKDPAYFYSRLISLIGDSKEQKLSSIILAEVNAQNIDIGNIYNLWKNGNEFSKWLIQNYVLIQFEKSNYIYMVMDSLEDLTNRDFIEKTYKCILDCKKTSLLSERNEILASIKVAEKDIPFSAQMENYYDNYLKNIIQKRVPNVLNDIDFTKDYEVLSGKSEILADHIEKEFAPYLTCYSSYERQMIIWLFRNRVLATNQVMELYPELYNYLGLEDSEAEPEDYMEQIDEYFRNYRKLRLAQEHSKSYGESLKQWNKDEESFYKWYFKGQIEYPDIYLKKKNHKGNTYVLDAVGAEFLYFILKALENKGCIIEEKAYGKCHLPSITSMAKKYYGETNFWLLDYDKEVIHGETYYHVSNIEKSLSVIERMIDIILDKEGDDEFAIISDHGATVGHKLEKKTKKYNFEKSEHDGRCYCKNHSDSIDTSLDYIIYNDDFSKEWVITLNQQSLYNNSKYEVHGGGTIEEVLVPIIIAHRGKKQQKKYFVTAVNLKVSGLHREVEFRITPTPNEEKVSLKAKDGTDVELDYNEETKTWTGELKRGIEQDVEVTVGIDSYNFMTVPPTKMGDDLFD